MNFGLKGGKVKMFAVDTDVASPFPVVRRQAVGGNLAVLDEWAVEEVARLNALLHLYRLERVNIAIGCDHVHISVIGHGGGEEAEIGSHIGHL